MAGQSRRYKDRALLGSETLQCEPAVRGVVSMVSDAVDAALPDLTTSGRSPDSFP